MLDCDQDALLVLVEPVGVSCHTGATNCFGADNLSSGAEILLELFTLIQSRKKEMPQKSYTTSLFKKGTDKICQKIYEEAAEVVRAAQKETPKRLVEESVDLLYHLFVLLVNKGVKFEQIIRHIKLRRKP